MADEAEVTAGAPPAQGKPDELRDALLAIQARAYLDDDEDTREQLAERLRWIYDSAGAWAARVVPPQGKRDDWPHGLHARLTDDEGTEIVLYEGRVSLTGKPSMRADDGTVALGFELSDLLDALAPPEYAADDVEHLLSLILDTMPAATNRDLAADGEVGDEEGVVWRKIEEKARAMRGER